MAKLPVLATVRSAYLDVWSTRQDLARLATPAVSILSLLSVATMWSLHGGANIGAVILVQLIGFIALVTPFSVAWLRRIIIHESSGSAWVALTWGRRQRRTLAVYLRIVVFSMISSVLIQIVTLGASQQPSPLIFVAPIVSLAVLVANARQFVQLPPEALDMRLSLSDVWRLTDANGFRLTGVLLLTTLPTLVVLLVVSGILGALASALNAENSLTFFLVDGIVAHSMQFISFAVLLTAYAHAHTALTSKTVALRD